MTSYIDIGDKSANGIDYVQVSVDSLQSDSVVVKNQAGDTLSYYTDTHSTAAGTLTAGNSSTFTRPVWLSSAGRTSVQITGGKH